MASETAIERRVAEALHRFDEYKHPRDRGGEFRGVPGSHLRRVIDDAQRLGRVHSKLRLRIDGGEDHLTVHAEVVGRAKAHAEEELAVHGYHLTPQNQIVRVDQDIPAQTPAERQSFWAARRDEAQTALDAATDPQDRAMIARHLARLDDDGVDVDASQAAPQPPDNPQQKRALRTNRAARKVRGRFPAGTRVRAVVGVDQVPGPVAGVVERHVPGLNAQGGYLKVRWDNGIVGRHSAISLMRDDAPEALQSPSAPQSLGAPQDRVPGAGAVVGGRAGRWVTVVGKMVHVPRDDAWEAEGSEGARLHSPSGTTNVYRNDRIVSEPGKKATHPDLIRPPRNVVAEPEPEPTEGDERRNAEPDDPPVIAPTDTAPRDPLAARRERASERAAEEHTRQQATAVPEPTEPVVPGSLKGADLTSVHPRAIDTELARLYEVHERARQHLTYVLRDSERVAARYSHMSPAGIESHRARAAEEADAARKAVNDVEDEIKPLDDEFGRRGGWARYFIVTNGNGHVHSSTRCSTCFQTTRFAWLPELAAKTEQQMVAEHGESACSVCFPSAPSLYEQMKARGELSTRAREEQAVRDARMAERAERQRLKDEKGIKDVDGSPLRTEDHGEIRTLVTARNELVQQMVYVIAGEAAQRVGSMTGMVGRLAQRQADVERLVAAIAHKTGDPAETIRATAHAKAAVKARRDWGIG